jgi:hypothetical protein
MRIDYYNKSKESNKYKVLRGFMDYKIVKEEELLVGDIVSVSPGEDISFDCLMVKGDALRVDESFVTGEPSEIKGKLQMCQAAFEQQLQEGNFARRGRENIPSPLILAESTVLEGSASVLVIALGVKSSSHVFKKKLGCPIKQSLKSKWTEFCHFASSFITSTQITCILILLILIFHSKMPSYSIEGEQALLNIFEALEIFLCMSVACIPISFVKIKHDIWSKFCYNLSENYKCSIRKFSTFNKLAAIDRILIPVEEFLFKDLASVFSYSHLSGTHIVHPNKASTKGTVLDEVKASRAREIIQNLVTMVYCNCLRNCPYMAVETFLHLSVFNEKTNLKVQTRIKFLKKEESNKLSCQTVNILARDFQVKKEYGFSLIKFGCDLSRITHIHNLETDQVTPLAINRKLELEAEIELNYKTKGLFPSILAYKELGDTESCGDQCSMSDL